jgi:iron complex transport system permease protein
LLACAVSGDRAGVSVGELSIPLHNVFYAISNKMGLTEVPLNRIYESVIWDFRLSRALVAACCGAGWPSAAPYCKAC